MKKLLFFSAVALCTSAWGFDTGSCAKAFSAYKDNDKPDYLVLATDHWNGKFGVADKQCNWAIPQKHNFITEFGNTSLFIVCKADWDDDGELYNTNCGIMDAKTGKWVLEQKYSCIGWYPYNSDATELCTKNAGGGKVDKNGKVVKAPVKGASCDSGQCWFGR